MNMLAKMPEIQKKNHSHKERTPRVRVGVADSNATRIFQEARLGKPGCLFCSPIDGMLIHSTNNFQVLIDTFPVVPGHLMISSFAHYGSAGEIPPNLQNELISLKKQLKSRIRALSGCHIFYEHGRAGCCMKANPNGSKCEHFHLHCLPVDISITDTLKSKFDCIEMKRYSDIAELFHEHGHYLYFESSNEKMYFFPAEEDKIESHLLRTLVCHALGIKDRDDWQNYTDLNPFSTSYDVVRSFIHFQKEAANA